MSRKSNRREFISGKAAGDAAADALDRALPDDLRGGDELVGASSYTMRVSRRAMACQFEICLSPVLYPTASDIAIEALDVVEALEEQLSYFRPQSELCQINARAADEEVEVEPRLFDLLDLAADIHRQTDGAFDLTSTPLWELWGFARRSGSLPTQEQIDEALTRVGFEKCLLDAARQSVRLASPDVRLNLGAIGKGYALDRCAENLSAAGVEHALISGGFSSMLARGNATGPASPEAGASTGWTVGIRNPLRPDRRLGEIRLCDRALATSGSYVQSFRFGGKRYGHIIDPRTGWPADAVLSTTVVAPSAAVADALSTAFYVMGLESTAAYCRTHCEIGAVLVCPSRTRGGSVVHVMGLGDDEVRLYEPAAT
jgi:thiamine biosynthesis lipoprotein